MDTVSGLHLDDRVWDPSVRAFEYGRPDKSGLTDVCLKLRGSYKAAQHEMLDS
jgi:hypothetical protein